MMPLLFIGHGSPMNAIEINEFSFCWRKIASEIPRPSAILCISAHWETRGTFITSMSIPNTIHDFGGFPDELYQVQYPAKGWPELAFEIKQKVDTTVIGLDHTWGLDHGTWSILMHFYPEADIPVLQLSLDHSRKPEEHIAIARQLDFLRKKDILIIGSGNLVHNLRNINWQNQNVAYDWAEKAARVFKEMIQKNDLENLANYNQLGEFAELAVPTPEHFLPLLYILALKQKDEKLSFFNEKLILGSIAMTSLKIGGI